MALLCAFGLIGCSAQPWEGFPTAIDRDLVWPAPPETPRVAFVMEIKSHRDLFRDSGFWRSLTGLLAGRTDSSLMRPSALAIHPRGGLVVTDPGRGMAHLYDWDRRRYEAIGPKRPGGLPSPVGVAVDRNGRILICDSRLQTVESFDSKGRWNGSFVERGVIERPVGIAIDYSAGETPESYRVYVTDVMGHKIFVFDSNGRPIGRIGKRGSEPGAFNFPTQITLDAAGRLVVTDSMNFRIQILEPDGTPVRSVGRLGRSPGTFSKPKGVAVDREGRLMAVEGLYGAIEFFDSHGRFLLHLGGSGQGPGEFWLPAGLTYDEDERLLFAADSYNSRVQVFRILNGVDHPLQKRNTIEGSL